MISFPFRLFSETEDFPIHIQYGFHDADLYEHSHEDFSELVIVLSGSSGHIVNGERYKISEGDIFVINQSVSHGFIEPDKMVLCNIMFKPEKVFSSVYDIKRLAGFQALFVIEPQYYESYGFCSQLNLNPEEFSSIKKFIDQLYDEYTKKQEGWKDAVFSGFCGLCIACSRLYKTERAKNKNDFFKLADVAAYIENNFSSQITTEQLSEISGYSQRQFLRVFKSTFSETPNNYITKLRIKKAKKLLESADISIGEIAWECGYYDQNYFSRIFRKHTGMSPSVYQSMIRKKQ